MSPTFLSSDLLYQAWTHPEGSRSLKRPRKGSQQLSHWDRLQCTLPLFTAVAAGVEADSVAGDPLFRELPSTFLELTCCQLLPEWLTRFSLSKQETGSAAKFAGRVTHPNGSSGSVHADTRNSFLLLNEFPFLYWLNEEIKFSLIPFLLKMYVKRLYS